jgi:hypothetical protein
MELKPKVVTNPFQWKGTRYHIFYSMLCAVRQKLNLLAEEIRLDLIQQESGEVTFHYSQVNPNMNIEQYLRNNHSSSHQTCKRYPRVHPLFSHIPSRLLQVPVDE